MSINRATLQNDWSATPSSNRHPQENFHVDISEFWHQRLGYISALSINRIPTISTNFDITTCKSCILAKQHKLPFKSRQELEVAEKLQLINSDLCGPLYPHPSTDLPTSLPLPTIILAIHRSTAFPIRNPLP